MSQLDILQGTQEAESQSAVESLEGQEQAAGTNRLRQEKVILTEPTNKTATTRKISAFQNPDGTPNEANIAEFEQQAGKIYRANDVDPATGKYIGTKKGLLGYDPAEEQAEMEAQQIEADNKRKENNFWHAGKLLIDSLGNAFRANIAPTEKNDVNSDVEATRKALLETRRAQDALWATKKYEREKNAADDVENARKLFESKYETSVTETDTTGGQRSEAGYRDTNKPKPSSSSGRSGGSGSGTSTNKNLVVHVKGRNGAEDVYHEFNIKKADATTYVSSVKNYLTPLLDQVVPTDPEHILPGSNPGETYKEYLLRQGLISSSENTSDRTGRSSGMGPGTRSSGTSTSNVGGYSWNDEQILAFGHIWNDNRVQDIIIKNYMEKNGCSKSAAKRDLGLSL